MIKVKEEKEYLEKFSSLLYLFQMIQAGRTATIRARFLFTRHITSYARQIDSCTGHQSIHRSLLSVKIHHCIHTFHERQQKCICQRERARHTNRPDEQVLASTLMKQLV